MEKRHNYVRKVAEVAVQMFISNDKVNTSGLVLAGSADFKTELSQSDMFDLVSAQMKASSLVFVAFAVTHFTLYEGLSLNFAALPVEHEIIWLLPN